MIARLHSVVFCGIEAVPIEVEVDVARRGFASVAVLGLPDPAVKESIERVRSAMRNSGYQFARYKTVVIDLDSVFAAASAYECDFGEVRGQEHVKRALTIAGAGMRNVLMLGPRSGYSGRCPRPA